MLEAFDKLNLPNKRSDNLEEAMRSHDESRQRIEAFLQTNETQVGDRSKPILAAFAAQKEYAACLAQLVPLARYLELIGQSQASPDWEWLREAIAWRDEFEHLRGPQKLDVDSSRWPQLRDRLVGHCNTMAKEYEHLDGLFEVCRSDIANFDDLKAMLGQMLEELPKHPLWLEKKRWQQRLPAYPELQELWGKVVTGEVKPQNVERLFCFNLLRLCHPIAEPKGPALTQTLHSFVQQDENLSSWGARPYEGPAPQGDRRGLRASRRKPRGTPATGRIAAHPRNGSSTSKRAY